MPRAPDLSGIALDGRYELLALIGEGAFGRVYRGRDNRLARDVAVKVIKPWWAEDPQWRRSFEREAQMLASINDSGIVQIFDVGTAPEGLYYVAELVAGESLADRLRRGPLAPSEACEIAARLARALARAHAQRVVHRDVKPANVLIARDGAIKVGDFGVARLAEGTSEGAAGTVAGTPQYMAPEQARGAATSPATDVYGIGVVLYEMLAGRPPFSGKNATDLALRHLHESPPPLPVVIPQELVEIVDRALAKQPEQRYADGAELAGALASARASLPMQELAHEAAHAPHSSRRSGAVAMLAPPETSTAVRADRELAAAEPLADAPVDETRVKPLLSSRRNFNPSERRQRVAIFATVLIVGLGLLLAALVLAPGHIRVPNLRRMTRARIIVAAKRAGFHPAFTNRYSQSPAGTAIDQTPSPGRSVSDGGTIAVVLSAGPPPVTVPKLIGSSLGDAEDVLAALKLQPEVTRVPAPGVAPGTVTMEPAAGMSRTPGSTVSLSVAEVPQPRALLSFAGEGNGQSQTFQIRGARWQVVYNMSYVGTCTFIFFCSGPSATVTNLGTGATLDSFGLSEGTSQTRVFRSGPGSYRIQISPGSDTARWSVTVEDYY